MPLQRVSILLLFCQVIVASASAAEKPNVILFIADDVSWNDFGCFDNPAARTPNIDRLSADGIRFTNAFLTASSCSPSRASIVTGRYPHNTGKAAELHLPIASNLVWFPELLRSAGYYTALSGKNHMTAAPSASGSAARPAAFDLIDNGKAAGNTGGHANWVKVLQNRPRDRPFFGWFAAVDAHRGWDGDTQWDAERYGPMHQPADVVVPPFLIDSAETRDDLASYYNEVTRFDYYVGQVVDELERQHELDNTLLLVLADNGRPFPRAKTRLHDSGMKTALVAHWPSGIQQAGSCDSLVSVIDLAPTVLELSGVPVADTMQGVSLRPLFDDLNTEVRRYAFSEHNWHDYEAHGRSVRDKRFLYIKNNRPNLAWQGPADSVRSPSHQALLAEVEQGDLTPAQRDVLLAPRPAEELYLVADDPEQLSNLVNRPEFAPELDRLRQLLSDWSEATLDSVPASISADSFDRQSGASLSFRGTFRGTTPGEDRRASQTNAPGPR